MAISQCREEDDRRVGEAAIFAEAGGNVAAVDKGSEVRAGALREASFGAIWRAS